MGFFRDFMRILFFVGGIFMLIVGIKAISGAKDLKIKSGKHKQSGIALFITSAIFFVTSFFLGIKNKKMDSSFKKLDSVELLKKYDSGGSAIESATKQNEVINEIILDDKDENNSTLNVDCMNIKGNKGIEMKLIPNYEMRDKFNKDYKGVFD